MSYNPQVFLSGLRSALVATGAIAATLGLVSADEAAKLADQTWQLVSDAVALGGAAVALGTAAYGMWKRTHPKIAESVAKAATTNPEAAEALATALVDNGASTGMGAIVAALPATAHKPT